MAYDASKVVRFWSFTVGITAHLNVSVRVVLSGTFPSSSPAPPGHLSEMRRYPSPAICPTGYFLGTLRSDDDEEDEHRFVLADKGANEWLFLNETTGDLFCNKNLTLFSSYSSSENKVVFEAEVYAKVARFGQFFFVKSVLIGLDAVLTMSPSLFGSSSSLVYEVSVSERTSVGTTVWKMPGEKDHATLYCVIVAGNSRNTFYVNTLDDDGAELVLAEPLDFMRRAYFSLLVRCSDSEIEVSVSVTRASHSYERANAGDLIAFSADVYEFKLIDVVTKEDASLVRLSAAYLSKKRQHQVNYGWYMKGNKTLDSFFGERFFLLDSSTGAITARTRRELVATVRDYCRTEMAAAASSFVMTVKAYNQVC